MVPDLTKAAVRPEIFVQHVTDTLRDFWAGRRVVLLLDDFDDRANALVNELLLCGAQVVAAVARTRPTAGAPNITHSWLCLDAGLQMSHEEYEAWLSVGAPEHLQQWLDGLDPLRQWVVLGTPRTGIPRFCDRAVYGWRRPQWAQVEDKTTIDKLLADAGVPTPAHTIVRAGEVSQLSTDIAGPDGVVVAADSSRGYVGDARGLRWVPHLDRLGEAVAELSTRAHRLRIARFTDGVPTSALGMALPDGLAVFSPIEIVTLGEPATGDLLFCGSSTHWRPGAAAEEEIRNAARRVGELLVQRTGYRGIFSVDGLLTAEGFTATELNPRHASGLGLRAALPEFPVYLFNRALQEQTAGLPGIAAAPLETMVRALVAANPSYSLSVPATSLPSTEHSGERRLRHATTVIEYHFHGAAARLSRITPAQPDGRAGPACAALADHLCGRGLRAFPLRDPDD
jgi:hypothetical protein